MRRLRSAGVRRATRMGGNRLADVWREAAVLLSGATLLLGVTPLRAQEVVGGTVYVRSQVGGPTGPQKNIVVPNVSVWLTNHPATVWQSDHVLSDSYGHFQIAKPDPGTYEIHYSATGYVPDGTCQPALVDVADDTVGAGQIPLRPLGQVISGTVTLGGLPATEHQSFLSLDDTALVRLVDGSGHDVANSVVVNEQGQWLLVNVPAGTWTLEASMDTSVATKQVTVALGSNGDCPDPTAVVVEDDALALPDNRPKVQYLLATDGTGHARQAAAPGTTVTVEAFATDDDLDYLHYAWSLGTAGYGQVLTPIQVPPRPPGMDTPKLTWTLPTVEGAFSLYVLVSDGRGGYAAGSISLNVSAAGLEFSGVAKGSDGQTISGATVHVNDITLTTDALGHFSTFIADGADAYAFAVNKDGYAPWAALLKSELPSATVTLPVESSTVVDPTAPIDVTQSVGGGLMARVEIGANQLLDPSNNPATVPLTLFVTGYDVTSTSTSLPGELQGIDPNGGAQAGITPYSGVRIRLADASGNRYHLATGQVVRVQLQVSPTLVAQPTVIQKTQLATWQLNGTSASYTEIPPRAGTLQLPGDPPVQDPPSFAPPFVTINLPIKETITSYLADAPVLIGIPLPNRACITLFLDGNHVKPNRERLRASYWDRGVFVTKTIDLPRNPSTLTDLPPNTSITLEVLIEGAFSTPFATQNVSSGPGVTCGIIFPCGCGASAFLTVAPPVDILNTFFTIFQNNGPTAVTYYQQADPDRHGAPFPPGYDNCTTITFPPPLGPAPYLGTRCTLNNFKRENNYYGTGLIRADDAIYYNNGDLRFGRRMSGWHDSTNGHSAYYVTNYDTAEDAVIAKLGGPDHKKATVAMEFSPTTGVSSGAPFVKFYVYDQNDKLSISAKLDGFDRFVPGLCNNCHALNHYNPTTGPDTVARYLPFDLDAYLYVNSYPGYDRASQEPAFKTLNQIVGQPGPYFTRKRSLATQTLLCSWYHTGTAPPLTPACPWQVGSSPTQDSNVVVSLWDLSTDPCRSGIPNAELRNVYLNSFKTSCRTCHVSRNSDKDWADYSRIVKGSPPMCLPVPSPPDTVSTMKDYVCGHFMPHAIVPYTNFWTHPERNSTLINWFNEEDVPNLHPACDN